MELSAENLVQKVQECRNILDALDFSKGVNLLSCICTFGETMEDCPAEITSSCAQLKQYAIDVVLRQLEESKIFERFQEMLHVMDEIVSDKEQLWKILHTDMNATLKVTRHETQLIAAGFFTPSELFEFGFGGFVNTKLCSTKNITNEEAIIDILYGVIGFVRGCNLAVEYETKLPSYVGFITTLLSMFVKLQDFDAHRFVWFVETIHGNLHIPNSVLRRMCDGIMSDYANEPDAIPSLNRLHKMCILSTSPFLQQIPTIRTTIEHLFGRVVEEQRHFVRKYIFSGFVVVDWDVFKLPETPKVSFPFSCWRLFLTNLSARLQEKVELPALLLTDFIEDALRLFEGYYGEVQPTLAMSRILRMEIFGIIDSVIEYYTAEMQPEMLRRIWYLLLIAVISGASDEDLKEPVEWVDPPDKNAPLLGIETNRGEVADYRAAFSVVGKKFEAENDAIQSMVTFVRAKYNQKEPESRESNEQSADA